MAFSFDVTTGIPRLNQSGTDTGLAGIATAIAALPSVERSTTFTTSAMRKPPIPNGMWYRCSTAGTSAATAPTYNPVVGSTTTDGTSVWTAFLAPVIQTLGTANHYFMPAIRFQITGTLTNANPQQQNFHCFDLFIFAGNFISGAWASDGVTPRWNGVHFITTRTNASGADPSAFFIQAGGQCTLIGGEVQVSGGVSFDDNTTPRSYKTRWRNTKEFGASSARFRSYTSNAIFQDVEAYDMAFDLFRMPTVPPSIKAIGSEYVYQYVGAAFGGADAKFSASALENPDGTYDFDNFASGWVELYNCAKGIDLNVVSQNPTTSILQKHLVPLFQNIEFTAKDTTGAVVENVRLTAKETPTNSPTVTFTTAGNLKTWDFINPLGYEVTTGANGKGYSSPVLKIDYWQSSFKRSVRWPIVSYIENGVTVLRATATYEARAANFKTTQVIVPLGYDDVKDASFGVVGLDTPMSVSETTASAITGISLVPSGANSGIATITAKNLQDVWNYYRWWISQFANRSSNDTWTCIGGVLDTGNWNVIIVGNVTKTANITSVKTTGLLTNNGTVNFPYEDSLGVRVAVSNLDPESFGVTWNLRYKKVADSLWTEITGTGNTTVILVEPTVDYDLQARVAGYTWKSITFNSEDALTVDLGLVYHVADDGTPQYLKPYNALLVDIFEYNDAEMSVEVTNTTGSIIQPSFNEMYQVIEKIQQNPDLVWMWVNPVTTNSTSQKVLVPPTSPLTLYLSTDSDASVKITCPVVYSDTGISADDRVKGNPTGYSIILGSSATADSSLIVSQLVEQLGGTGYDTETHSLTKIKVKVDKSLTKTQFLGFKS